MSSLDIDQTIYNKQICALRLSESEISISNNIKNENSIKNKLNVIIKKEDIKNIELFRSRCNFCLRIFTSSTAIIESNKNAKNVDESVVESESVGGNQTIFNILNLNENIISSIQDYFKKSYGLIVGISPLETLLTTEGNLIFSNNLLNFHNGKTIFSIEKDKISKVFEIDNQLQITIKDSKKIGNGFNDRGENVKKIINNDVEIVMTTSTNVASHLQSKRSEEVCVIESIPCINPRSKTNLLFFDNYLEARGTSYDHTIFYENISQILNLKTLTEKFLVLKLNNSILQGQTKYDGMVFSLDSNKEIEVAAKSKFLKEYYKGAQSDVVLEILEKVSRKEALTSTSYFNCINKINEGNLFCLPQGLHFLPKALSIQRESINFIEFHRLGVASGQLKTFDISIDCIPSPNIISSINTSGNEHYLFTNLKRERYHEMETYCNDNGIKMVFTQMDDDYSSSSYLDEEEGSDLSGIVADDESDSYE